MGSGHSILHSEPRILVDSLKVEKGDLVKEIQTDMAEDSIKIKAFQTVNRLRKGEKKEETLIPNGISPFEVRESRK